MRLPCAHSAHARRTWQKEPTQPHCAEPPWPQHCCAPTMKALAHDWYSCGGGSRTRAMQPCMGVHTLAWRQQAPLRRMPCMAHMHVALARMAEPLRTHGAARRTHRITLAALLLASALTMASALPPWDVADDSSSAGHAARCGGNGQGQRSAIVVGEAACVGGFVRAPRRGQQHAGCSTASVAARTPAPPSSRT